MNLHRLAAWILHELFELNKELWLNAASQHVGRYRASYNLNDRFLHRIIITGDKERCLYISIN